MCVDVDENCNTQCFYLFSERSSLGSIILLSIGFITPAPRFGVIKSPIALPAQLPHFNVAAPATLFPAVMWLGVRHFDPLCGGGGAQTRQPALLAGRVCAFRV